MTRVKICGLKRKEDVLYVNKLKPDYVGFVFAKSKRQINKDHAKELVDLLDNSIKKVGVFLNNPLDMVKEITEFCSLDIIQLHGDESPEYCNLLNNSLNKKLWKAFRIKDNDSLIKLHDYNPQGYLLDTYVKGAYGGTGEIFNWSLASKISKDKYIILAGGLCEENIEKAITIVKPSVVDVSSGVESNGYKDFDKMKKFIKKTRRII